MRRFLVLERVMGENHRRALKLLGFRRKVFQRHRE